MAAKRPCIVEGNTPGKPTCKRPVQGKSRRNLFDSETETFGNIKQNEPSAGKCDWTLKEKSALVQYICLFWKDAWNDKWPMTKDNAFWNSCASAVNNACHSNRTGL